jgi:acyl-[acyl carrier protein]--UDP-N-acetylglucosamine O-acyltransferase
VYGYAMAGAFGKFMQDVLPFMPVQGKPSQVGCVKAINLQCHGFSQEETPNTRRMFKIFHSSGLSLGQAMVALLNMERNSPFGETVLAPISASTPGFE